MSSTEAQAELSNASSLSDCSHLSRATELGIWGNAGRERVYLLFDKTWVMPDVEKVS